MESQSDQPPLIAVVGETGSGKTALAIELAKRFNGEIITADSRTIYKGMDIGTAKPTYVEQQGIVHHLLDIVKPDQAYSVATFKVAAELAIDDIAKRGKIPILVGGSGLYVDAVLFGYMFGNRPNIVEREKLQRLTVAQLQALIEQRALPMPMNPQNPRHLMRVLETGGIVDQPKVLRPHTLVIGLQIERSVLLAKLQARVELMLQRGFIDEVVQLATEYGWDAPGMYAPGYRSFRPYIDGVQTLAQVTDDFIASHRKLAKRQRTWFKRNKSIHWVQKQAEAVDLVTTFLNK